MFCLRLIEEHGRRRIWLRIAFDFVYYKAFIDYTYYKWILEGYLAGQDHIVTSIIEERLEKKKGNTGLDKTRSVKVDYSVVF